MCRVLPTELRLGPGHKRGSGRPLPLASSAGLWVQTATAGGAGQAQWPLALLQLRGGGSSPGCGAEGVHREPISEEYADPAAWAWDSFWDL